tara:strand:+ start:67 stop:552 length:486 start_codon:yes stop_codon:yes gene_type:complete
MDRFIRLQNDGVANSRLHFSARETPSGITSGSSNEETVTEATWSARSPEENRRGHTKRVRLTGATPLMILLLFYTFYLAIAYTKPITGGDEMLPYRVDLQNDPAYILELLPGIGPTRALQIVEYRKSNAITSPQDLVNVHGIGQKTVDELWRLTICGSDPE